MNNKRIIALALTLLLAVGMAPAALAKQIQLYGGGSKKEIKLEDEQGREFIYYDIYGGATTREDTRDTDNFMREILRHEYNFPKGKHYVASMWDLLLFNELSAIGVEGWRGKSLNANFNELRSYYSSEYNLTMSTNAEQTEKAIREKMAQIVRNRDKNIQADHYKEIQGLKDLKFSGPCYFTTNLAMRPGYTTMAFGTIFYDFQATYVEDGKTADSAVGKETDINKLKGKRGFKMNESTPTVKKSAVAENNTKKSISQSVTMTEDISSSVTNSVETSSTTTKGFTVGTEVESTVKFPLLGESSLKVSTEFNMSWAATTARGESKTISKTQSYSNSVTVDVPPRSKMVVDLMNQKVDYGIEYDYPIGITFKVAQYVIYNQDKSFICSLFGQSGSEGNQSATQNLRSRWEHRNNSGYEESHSQGHNFNWNGLSRDEDYFGYLQKYIPMSITGGRIGLGGDSLTIKVNNPIPLVPVETLELMPGAKNQLAVGAGQQMNLYDNLEVIALDGGLNGEEPMECYGFDDDSHGAWVLCDENGKAADSALAKINSQGWLVAGEQVGTVYAKYLLDEKKYPYSAPSQEEDSYTLSYSSNDKIDNKTLVKIDIVNKVDAFTGTVALSGSLEADFGERVALNRLAMVIKDSAGNEVAAGTHPVKWYVDDQPVSANYLANAAGTHQVKVGYGGVMSNGVPLVVGEPADVGRIDLNPIALELEKGASFQLGCQVFPENADLSKLTWSSSNEKVVTVESGKVIAQGTGQASVICKIGDVEAVCAVTVVAAEPGATLSQGKLAMVKGKKFTLGSPKGTTGTWSVKDEAIATVTPAGKVVAKALGNTELVFTVDSAQDGAKFLDKAVYGGDKIVLPLSVRKSGEVVTKVNADKKLTLAVGEEQAIATALKPAGAIDKELYYQSSDKKTVLVDDEGKVTGVKPGKATVTITSCSGKQAKVTVTVADKAGSIKLNVKKQTIAVDEAFQITATAVPEIAGFKPIFKVKNEKIVAVDENGLVTGLKKGKTVVTVYADETKKVKAQCTITVK